jgi:RNA recognition motif-containing protein
LEVQGTKTPGKLDQMRPRLKILDRTNYTLDVTVGQRKYGGPPPGMDPTAPGHGHEIFCGKIPKDIFEDELIPLFEECGQIWDLRLMMDPLTGLNRGYCFVTYVDKEGAQRAVEQLNDFEVKPGKKMKVNISVANLRLFVGNIPKSKSKEEIMEEFSKLSECLADVIIYSSPDDSKKKNRGFAFLEYQSHKDASVAKRRIGNGRTRVWGCDIIVDWADPQEEPDDDTMSKVKVLYVRNLKSEVSEDELREKFESYGKIERVKKIKDYGFVHFENRDDAVRAMEELHGTFLSDLEMQISLAKPPSENRQKQKQKRQEQQRMQMMMQRGFEDWWMGPGPMVPPRGRGGMRAPFRGDYYDDMYDFAAPFGDDYFGGSYYDYYEEPMYGGGYGRGMRGRGAMNRPPAGRGRGLGGTRGPGAGALSRGPRGGRGGAPRGGSAGGRNAVRGGPGNNRGGARGGHMMGVSPNMQAAAKRKAPGDTNPVFYYETYTNVQPGLPIIGNFNESLYF